MVFHLKIRSPIANLQFRTKNAMKKIGILVLAFSAFINSYAQENSSWSVTYKEHKILAGGVMGKSVEPLGTMRINNDPQVLVVNYNYESVQDLKKNIEVIFNKNVIFSGKASGSENLNISVKDLLDKIDFVHGNNIELIYWDNDLHKEKVTLGKLLIFY